MILLLKKSISLFGMLCLFHLTQAQWADNGTNLTTSDNVGIGTTDPTAPLEIRNSQSAGTSTVVVNNTWANYSTDPALNRPLTIRRGISDNESLKTYVQDTKVHHYYKNDEAYSAMEFRFENTDMEVGSGANASNNVPLYLFSNFTRGGAGINTNDIPPGYAFAVDGKAIMEEVKVEVSGSWPDYVFSEEYQIPSLENTESYIRENKHLPGIPSAEEVKEAGISLGEMNAKLLEKIEELTLHVIELEKKNNLQDELIQKLIEGHK